MRILIGSIAMIDDGEEPAITSPDYVVFTTRAGTLHHKFFYYWLRSISGATFIRRLARGAVRERLMFPRLSAAEVEMPRWDVQMSFIRKMALIDRARAAAIAQLTELDRFPALLLRDAFSGDR
jgi:type I restriction enzyme S subunit